MSKGLTPGLLLTMLALMTACGDAHFQKEYAEAQKSMGQPDFASRLFSLDQKYPNHLALKVDLGAYFLAHGALDEARAYLSRGETLAGSSSDQNLKSVLWADLAQESLVDGDASQAVKYANRSLENRNEKLGVILTRAKAHLLKGEKKEALADFQTGWETKRVTMTAQDYELYAKTLITDGRYADALNVLETYRDVLPYELGTGLVESVCYENLGRYDESVLAAFIDVNFQESRGLIKSAQVIENLRALESKIKARGLSPEKSGLTTLKAVEAWALADWKAVDFDDHLLASSTDARFLKLSALLELGKVGDADLKAYSDLERRFHDFPSYYLSLLHYLEKTRKDLHNSGFETIAEKVINLAPQGPWAEEGRLALALGYGLPADEAPVLLTRAQVDQSIAQGDLTKIVKLWSTQDNPSSQYAIDRLRTLSSDPNLGSQLVNFAAVATGRAKEKLNLVIQSR